MIKRILTESKLFFLLLLIHLLYVWVIPVFLTQDGPIHLYNASIFRDLLTHQNETLYAPYFKLNWHLFPNWLSTPLLSILLTIFSPVVAEKILISFLILGLPLAVRYALRQINPAAVYLSSLVFILSNGYFLLYGFYNFQMSFILFFLFTGLYFRSREHMGSFQLTGLAILAVLIFFTHPVALVILCAMTGIDMLLRFIRFLRSKDKYREEMLKCLQPMFIMLPGAILFMIYFLAQPPQPNPLIELKVLSFHFWGHLLVPLWYKVFSEREFYIYILFSVLLFVIVLSVIKGLRKERLNEVSLVLTGVLLVLLFMYFFITDTMAGGGLLTVRLGALIYLFILLIAAQYNPGVRLRHLVTGFSCILVISLLIIRYPIQKRVGEAVADYIKAGQSIPDGSVILAMGYSNRGEINDEVWCHGLELFGGIGGYIATNRPLVSIQNSEADTDYFPVRLVDATNPFHYLSGHLNYMDGLGSNPPVLKLQEYNRRKNCRIGYIVLWGDDSRLRSMPEYTAFRAQLNESYQLHFESEDGLTKIYKWVK